MNREEKLSKIEELVGRVEPPVIMGVDEVIDIVHKHMLAGSTYALIKGKISLEAKVLLSQYNIEVQTETYTAGHNSTVTNTLRWIFKHKQNGKESNKA